MQTFLIFGGVGCWIVGALWFFGSPGAIGEIGGMTFVISGCVLFIGGAIVAAIQNLDPEVKAARKRAAELARTQPQPHM